jgi:hypothetical protein
MKNTTVNNTEEFVLQICTRTCLSMWACNNPYAEQGKELCDILIVCDPDVIIVSVKDIHLNTEKEVAGFDRWERKAIDDSVRQIYGAERSLATAIKVRLKNGAHGLDLPPLADRKIHRIAVAFGSQGQVPIKSGDFGKGFVHVMHEHSFFHLLTELDTITDLVNYLAAKESLPSRCALVVEGSETNLLGMYLFNNRAFPNGTDFIVVEDTVWSELNQRPEWKRRKEADEPSYAWDRLIEMLADPRAKSIEGAQPELNDLELALRSMARETRFYRRILGGALREFLTSAKAKKLRSRAIVSPSGVIYVLVYFTAADDLKHRTPELALRCAAARKKAGRGEIVVGIGIGEHEAGKGSTSDLVYLCPENWAEFIAKAEGALQASGYFAESFAQKSHHDEYPNS